MNQEIREQLSAFMDGELGRDQTRFLVRRIESDGSLVESWSRYHVARQALRRQSIVALRADFSSSVMAGIGNESVPQSGFGGWVRLASGGAIAAAVAVAALVVTKPAGGPAPGTVANGAPTVVAEPARAQPELAAVNDARSRDPRSPALVPNSPIQTATASFGTDLVEPASYDPRLQSYVIRHYEATGATGQSDFVPYILLVPQNGANQARPIERR